jgi:hypothetical protein
MNQNLDNHLNDHQKNNKAAIISLSKSIFDSEYHSDKKSHRNGRSDNEQNASLKIRTSA